MTGPSDQPGELAAGAPSSDYGRRLDMAFDAAREFIRLQFQRDGCVIGIGEVLEHLDERFGRSSGLTTDVDLVLGLSVALWEDPDIHQVADGGIEFWWTGAGDRQQEAVSGLRARLVGGSDSEELA